MYGDSMIRAMADEQTKEREMGDNGFHEWARPNESARAEADAQARSATESAESGSSDRVTMGVDGKSCVSIALDHYLSYLRSQESELRERYPDIADEWKRMADNCERVREKFNSRLIWESVI